MGQRTTVVRALVALTMAIAPATAQAATGCPSGHRADGNDCDWHGGATGVAGTSRYSRGEFVYSDYIHDDAGANVDGLTSNNPDRLSLSRASISIPPTRQAL